MRVTCLLDNLGSGGAQRQLSTLAVFLKQSGREVDVLTYHPQDFFLPLLREVGVGYRCLRGRSRLRRVLQIRRALCAQSPDVVLAFLPASCLYAELAALPSRRWGLVVSERSAEPTTRRDGRHWLRQLHSVADYVTTNSHTNRLMLESAVPRLAGRVSTIYNLVDLTRFRPAPHGPSSVERGLSLVVAARYSPEKNVLGMVEATAIVRAKAPQLQVSVDWYGNRLRREAGGLGESFYVEAGARIQRWGLHDCFRLHSPHPEIAEVFQGASAVVLPSFFEGLPNVACEAMACGRPLLMSDVCDAGNLVVPGRNGFLFDPTSPEEIARTILEFGALSRAEREALGARGREMAEGMFDPARSVARYVELLEAAAGRTQIRVRHWVPDVPLTAYRSAA